MITAETDELAAVKKRIAELETELAIAQRAVDLLKEETTPKAGTRPRPASRRHEQIATR